MRENRNGKKRWTQRDIGSQKGKNVVVTGTGGLGFETAIVLAGAGANVIITGRNVSKGSKAVQKIKAKYPKANIEFQRLDLADLSSVASFSKALNLKLKKLDVLINNAGVMAVPDRQVTKDGFELQFGTNYLGHFALTAHLLPLLRRTRNARVVTVSSMAHRSGRINFDDLQSQQSYNPDVAYSQSKLACLMFSSELQKHSLANGWGITSIGVHPGGVATNLIENGPGKTLYTRLIFRFLQTPSQGARSALFAATSPKAKGGYFYGPTGLMEIWGKPKLDKPAKQAMDLKASNKLWDVSSRLVNVDFS
ncbi:putative oxidoreductase-Short-chain dehydrogenase [Furfurilactobacillus rossiae]|uniref:oxidoreductase n=1 Tax=Furfurilactobacillus rossiae TaxID=231049 RepID=UPI0015BC82AB|nr:oxidoreductase [Furfurilactobacillus rossiae]MCF6166268.1 SDR family oxidoreductase [Furfurilactobacillus rossiae]QLE65290.1 putative oxidoreductase-Short-chain dehydrogenase [Furfurilactobacillus rossiae]